MADDGATPDTVLTGYDASRDAASDQLRAEAHPAPVSDPTHGQDATPEPDTVPEPDAATAQARARAGWRRHRRQTLTFAGLFGGVMVLGLFAAAVVTGTWSWPFGGAPASAGATPCTAPTAQVQAAALTTVRVYNASSRRGLALATARELQKRGFTVPEPPRNDPLESKPPSAAVIRHGAGGLVAARTVATQVKGTVAFEQDNRLGETVDLVLGQAFALVDPAGGVAALKRTPGPSSCAVAG